MELEFTKVPLKSVITPVEGLTVVCDNWFVVTDDNYALAYRGKFLQYNRHKHVIEHYIALRNFYPYKCHAEYLPVAYIDRRFENE